MRILSRKIFKTVDYGASLIVTSEKGVIKQMGSYSYGKAKYNYNLTINIHDLVDEILEKIGISGEDWHLDDNSESVVIEGGGSCRYKNYYSPATYYDPPEDETELIGAIDEIDIDKAIIDALEAYKEIVKTKSVYNLEIDEDNIDYDPDEPDEDAIYDEWKDRGGDYFE